MRIRARTRVHNPHSAVAAEVESPDAIWLMTASSFLRKKPAAASVDDGCVEVDAIWSLLPMEIGAAETLNPARVLPTDGAN